MFFFLGGGTVAATGFPVSFLWVSGGLLRCRFLFCAVWENPCGTKILVGGWCGGACAFAPGFRCRYEQKQSTENQSRTRSEPFCAQIDQEKVRAKAHNSGLGNTLNHQPHICRLRAVNLSELLPRLTAEMNRNCHLRNSGHQMRLLDLLGKQTERAARLSGVVGNLDAAPFGWQGCDT